MVELEPGSPIPADGLYISGQNVTSDESPMTGESDSVRKDEDDPFMLSGCTVSFKTRRGNGSDSGESLRSLINI